MARHQPHLLLQQIEGPRIEVDTETRRHLEKALRYPDGASVSYTDGEGLYGVGSWQRGVVVRGQERRFDPPQAPIVAVAPPRSTSRVRFLVEKLGELGVGQMLWLETAYGEGKPPRPEKARAWAQAALEQSRGAWLMKIGGPIAIDELPSWGTPVFAVQGGPGSPPVVHDPVFCVGPEGGFAAGELPVSAHRLDLGDTVLRVETAAIVGAALFRLLPPAVEERSN